MSKGKKTEGFNTDANKKLLFFKADWCGHCTRFKPVWDEFKEESKTKYPNVELMELNIDNEESKPLMQKHNVRGFPHVVLTSENTDDVVFTRNRTKEDLLAFIQEQA
jgi:thiol-disulfide isomerase/thioredoxin